MYFCIAGLLDDNAQNEIRGKTLNILRRYGLGVTALLLPQHISLKISFATDQVDDLLAYFDDLCLRHFPFNVTLQNLEMVAIYEHDAPTGLLWYNVREDARLRTIHNQLNADLPELLGISNSSIDGNRFRFHSTVSYGGKSYEEYRKIHAAVADEFNEINARIDKLAVFCSVQETAVAGQFFTLKTRSLGRNRPKRIQFWGEDEHGDSLVREILAGEKTATVTKADEFYESDGDFDDGGLEVGDLVDVFDLKQRLRCRIRITEVYPVRFGEIPEKLWKAEVCRSAEHFQEAHRHCWPDDDLNDDFEMMAIHFELVEIVQAATSQKADTP